MTVQHAALWLDHHAARLFRLTPDHVQKVKVHNDRHHFHRDQDSPGSRRERDRIYFSAVADTLGGIPEILLLGPGMARTEFLSWLEEHRPAQRKQVLDSQACEDGGDDLLVEKARAFFRAADRMLPRR